MKKSKKIAVSGIIVMLIASFAVLVLCTGCQKNDMQEATFEGYSQNNQEVTDKNIVFNSDNAVYKFALGNESKLFKIRNSEDGIFRNPVKVPAEDGAFAMQNQLKVGQKYDIQVQGDTITALKAKEQTQAVENGVVSYAPGQRTLKNLLKTAVAPLGTLMVVGGGWDLQDVGSGNEARTIGVDSVWKTEYSSQNTDYSWENTFPHNGWNKDHSRGLDASGYLGWVLYNTMYSTNLDHPGLVASPKEMTDALSQKYNYGADLASSWQGLTPSQIAQQLKTGDIIALKEHIFLVVGVCSDRSIVIAHCATATSKTGANGGGVQLSALNIQNDQSPDCEAYRLIKDYTQQKCPQWAERYDPIVKSTEVYLSSVQGAVEMDLKQGMFTDPDNYATKNAKEILADIFG